MSSEPPLDAGTIAEIERRLSKMSRETIAALPHKRGQGAIAWWNWWLGPAGGGIGAIAAWPPDPPSAQGLAWREAACHLGDIRREREDAEVEAAHEGLAATDEIAAVMMSAGKEKPGKKPARFEQIAARMRKDIAEGKTTKETLAALPDKKLMRLYPGGRRTTTRKAVKSLN